jgi:putative Ca2+/H+ antiporter (TMEM165/GDT1 family)
MALLEADAALSGDSGFLPSVTAAYAVDASMVGSSTTLSSAVMNYAGELSCIAGSSFPKVTQESNTLCSGGSLFLISAAKTSVSNTLRGPQTPVVTVPVAIPPVRIGPVETHRTVYSVDTSTKRRGQ